MNNIDINSIEFKRKLRNYLAHAGHNNSSIAKELGISEGTVRKLLKEDEALPPSALLLMYLNAELEKDRKINRTWHSHVDKADVIAQLEAIDSNTFSVSNENGTLTIKPNND